MLTVSAFLRSLIVAALLIPVVGCDSGGGPPTPQEVEAQKALGELEVRFKHNRQGRVVVADLGNSAVEDPDLAHLRAFDRVEEIVLSGTAVTDPGLKYLKTLTRLKRLGLKGTATTDSGLESLVDLPLEELDLEETKVSDAGLKHLAQIGTLKKLYLGGTSVNYKATQELQKALPQLKISTS